MAKENAFQQKFIKTLYDRFPGCIISKNDAGYRQGIPDVLILYKTHWAAFECKRDKNSPHQPNQDYYVEKLNAMSYAAFVYPENMEEVINEVQSAWGL